LKSFWKTTQLTNQGSLLARNQWTFKVRNWTRCHPVNCWTNCQTALLYVLLLLC
jgi:hypothetical protein